MKAFRICSIKDLRHVELSEVINQKKKSRFRYKIKELIYSKVEELVSKSLINEQEIDNIIESALNNSKFKIYQTIHDKFEEFDFKIKKQG